MDSTFIRSCEEGARHRGVRVGNVETVSGGRQVFGAVTKADTDLSALIRRNLGAVGRTDDTEVTAFTYGCPGPRSILVDAAITTPPILDWFHIAMRMQHTTQTASSLPAYHPARHGQSPGSSRRSDVCAGAFGNGKARNGKRSIDRVRKVMHGYKEERGHNMRSVPSRRLWHALLDVDGYLKWRYIPVYDEAQVSHPAICGPSLAYRRRREASDHVADITRNAPLGYPKGLANNRTA